METDPTPDSLCNSPTKPRRGLLPNGDARKLFDRWKSVLPLLVAPLLSYVSSTVGEKWIVVKGVKSQCRSPTDCHIQTKEVLCLFVSRKLRHFLIIIHNPECAWQISKRSTSLHAIAKTYFRPSSSMAFFRLHRPNPASLFQLNSSTFTERYLSALVMP